MTNAFLIIFGFLNVTMYIVIALFRIYKENIKVDNINNMFEIFTLNELMYLPHIVSIGMLCMAFGVYGFVV